VPHEMGPEERETGELCNAGSDCSLLNHLLLAFFIFLLDSKHFPKKKKKKKKKRVQSVNIWVFFIFLFFIFLFYSRKKEGLSLALFYWYLPQNKKKREKLTGDCTTYRDLITSLSTE